MDTDSSLPPLLFLAVSLLAFAWASVVVATRRRRFTLAMLLDNAPSPFTGFLRFMAAGIVGVSTAAYGLSLFPDWPLGVLLASIGGTAAALVALHLLIGYWAASFPQAARRLARPHRWFAANGSGGGDGDPAVSQESYGHPSDGAAEVSPDPFPLTAAEILNLDEQDIDMVRSISRMDDQDVQDIMVPRLDVDAVELESSLDVVVEAFVSTKHTRLPVFRGTMDDVVGIVHISDVLPALAADSTPTVEQLMRPAEFVAENMAVDDLLHLMLTRFLQMAIVVDEYGGVEGIVTLEDVLEEIVGEIDDEFAEADDEVPSPDPDGSWSVAATTPVQDVNRIIGVRLDGRDVNTIGGYVYTALGRMPTTGDTVTGDQVSIEVTQMRGRRIQRLKLVPLQTELQPRKETGASAS